MAENFPNLGRELVIHIQDPKELHQEHYNYCQKSKTKNFKATYNGTPLKLSMGFKAKTTQARREWDDIFKMLGKKKGCQPRMLYPAKLSLRNEIKTLALTKAKPPSDLPYKKCYREFFKLK